MFYNSTMTEAGLLYPSFLPSISCRPSGNSLCPLSLFSFNYKCRWVLCLELSASSELFSSPSLSRSLSSSPLSFSHLFFLIPRSPLLPKCFSHSLLPSFFPLHLPLAFKRLTQILVLYPPFPLWWWVCVCFHLDTDPLRPCLILNGGSCIRHIISGICWLGLMAQNNSLQQL